MKRYLLPLVAFLGLVVFLALGLKLDPREVPSPLIGKLAPAFQTELLARPEAQTKRDDMLGKVWLLNVWASWCVACREEHPVLMAFARRAMVPIYGLNYKDKREDGLKWLRQFGNPYTESLYDPQGRIGLDYGVYGVPETFVIDRAGVVRYKHVGPITPEFIRNTLEPLLRKLNG